MSMTWRDIKLATLQKMFAAEGSTIPTDESTVDYLAGMPYVANEALQRLSSAGKFITKSIVIAHNPLCNLLDELTAKAIHSISGSYEFSENGANSIYFEFSGIGSAEVYVDGTLANTYTLSAKGTYLPYRFLCSAEEDEEVKVIITTSFPSTIKNIALYEEGFTSADDIPTYAQKVRYFLRDIVDDFYNMTDNQIYYEGGTIQNYLQTTDYYRESDKVLLLDRDMPGSYTVYYHAYPPEITLNTEDDYELPIDREVAVLMPLYMASQLYMDDDSSIATMYRNQFETGLDSLQDTSVSAGFEHFTSESGWW